MSPWINYHHLYYFKVIAEEGGVSKAAERLRLGQPTLSAQLKQFEESLGVKLFERSHKRLTLSEHGKVALEYARQIFSIGSEMYEVLHDRLAPTKTHLEIGALDGIPKEVTLALTTAAYRVSPCLVTIVEGRPDEIIRELTAHRLDLMLTNFIPTAREARGLVHRSLSRQTVGIFGAPKFAALKKNFPTSLDKQKFVMPTYDSKLRYDIEHWAKTRSIALDIIAETQDIGLKKLMATEGIGLIPAAGHTVHHLVQSGELVEIGRVDGTSEELFLVAAQRKVQNPVAAALMKDFQLRV